MKLLGLKNVKLEGGFLKDKLDLVRNETVDAVWNRFYETGRVGAYECDPKAEFPAHVFWDSDVIKWAEGAAYYLGLEYDKELDDKINMLAELMEKNAFEDGYYNCYYAVHPELTRFTNRNNHELYCAGHLFEAAVAYYEATGNDRLIKISSKYVDCITKIFMEEKGASFTTPGHQEIELALLRLYDVTGDEKYLDLARFFLVMRGHGIKEDKGQYNQSHVPVVSMDEAVGHSVRACYLYSGMADYAAVADDTPMAVACKRLFDNIAKKKMYITGGIGSTKLGEAFTEAYDLPNDLAYAETCASIALLFFATRMQRLQNDSKYADVAERALYNGVMSGLSLDGVSFFYTNPLEINMRNRSRYKANVVPEAFPITQRKRVFGCSCCPPNIVRLMPSLAAYAYGVDGDTLYVNQYMDSSVDLDGMKVKVTTVYPVNGNIKISASGTKRIALRIPDWCKSFTLDSEYTMQNGYAVVENPSELTLVLDMPVRFVKANPKIAACRGKVAVMRGPIVYCAERVDNNFDIFSFFAGEKSDVTVGEAYGGLPTVEFTGHTVECDDVLYSDSFEPERTPRRIKLIPYYAFANRGESDMAVWLND